MSQPESLTRLIDQLQRLPGIGRKSAQRLAFHLMKSPREEADRLCDAVREMRDTLAYCSVCNHVTDSDPCSICSDASRNVHIICVVEEPHNGMSIDRARDYNGLYHVLMGALSPLQGVGPGDLRIQSLLKRVEAGGVDEIILATNPTVEGESTAIYLARLLKPLGVRVTRIAMGVPVGSDLEYADDVTMHKAMEGRREV